MLPPRTHGRQPLTYLATFAPKNLHTGIRQTVEDDARTLTADAEWPVFLGEFQALLVVLDAEPGLVRAPFGLFLGC